MTSCTSCGHQLGVGRFCTSCGAPVSASGGDPAPFGEDWRTDTAERKLPPAPPTDPRTPPSAVAPPPPPRYPLYADEVEGYSAAGPLTGRTDLLADEPPPDPVAPAVEEPAYHDQQYDYDYSDERRSPVLWILATVLVLVLVAAGWWFLVRDAGADSAQDNTGSGSSESASADDEPATRDVARTASAEAPSTAPPSVEANGGDQVSFDASNMLDGVPTTAWRAEGDATGAQLVFTLPAPTELVQVGMINGYAKKVTDDKGRTFDWYRGNRRVNAVVWAFDDGTKVRQQLALDTRMQLKDLGKPVTTTTVTVTLVRVSPPGDGDAARDFTAVSEVSLVSPAGS